MSTDATTFARTVMAMRPMVPAKDFEISKRFYIELGFQPKTLTDRLVEMQLGAFSFILQTDIQYRAMERLRDFRKDLFWPDSDRVLRCRQISRPAKHKSTNSFAN
jgi:hypothetical protein